MNAIDANEKSNIKDEELIARFNDLEKKLTYLSKYPDYILSDTSNKIKVMLDDLYIIKKACGIE